jgi:hypothetical protein
VKQLIASQCLRTLVSHVDWMAQDDLHVSCEINAFREQPIRMAQTYWEVHQNIQDRFYEARAEIMSPHCFGVREGNHVA